MAATTYTQPRTWTAGEIVAAQFFNRDVRDNLDFIQTGHSVRLEKESAQRAFDDTETSVEWEGVGHDTDGFAPDTRQLPRLRIPGDRDDLEGVYLMAANIDWQADSSGDRRSFIDRIYITGDVATTERIANHRHDAVTNENTVQVSTMRQLDPGTTVRCVVRQTSGGALNIQATNECHFFLVWMGRTV